jgi:excisionase family DNA binding protein
MTTQRLITIDEASVQLNCSPETLRRAIRRKELLAKKDPLSKGPRYVIEPSDLAAFLEKRRNG